MIKGELMAAGIAVPGTLLVLGVIASSTAAIQSAPNQDAIRRTLIVASGGIIAATAMTGNLGAVIAAIVTVGAIAYVTDGMWPWREGV